MGASASSTSTQVANSNITQQFSGTCNITCENKMDKIDIQLFNVSDPGGINVTQTCVVNGQCLIQNNSTSVSDVLFKAANSATASAGFSLLPSETTNSTYQEINQNVQEYSTEKCNVNSVNSMSNVSIFAANSQLGEGINIGQYGQTNGNCALSNVMNASTTATGISDNCAASGKASKKKACSGKGGGLGSLILYGIVGVIIFVVVMMIIRFMRGGQVLPCEKPDGTFMTEGPCKKPDGTLLPKGMKYVKTPVKPFTPLVTTPKTVTPVSTVTPKPIYSPPPFEKSYPLENNNQYDNDQYNDDYYDGNGEDIEMDRMGN